MKTEYLYYFIVASNASSFTKAAEELHISQQGLSRVIKLLEAEYGRVLFKRGDKKTELTDAGKELRLLAENVLEQYEQLERCMKQHDLSRRDNVAIEQITIFMTLNAMHNIFPVFSYALSASFPNTRFNISEVDQKDVHRMIAENEDPNTLFFISLPESKFLEYFEDSDIAFRPLLNTHLDCIVGRSSPLSSRTSFRWADLEKYEFVLKKDPGMLDLLEKRNALHPISEFAVWTTDTKFLEAILNTRDAVSFSTSFLGLYPDLDDFVHIPLENTFNTPVGFMLNAKQDYTALAWAVIRFVEGYFCSNYPKGLFQGGEVVGDIWTPVSKEPDAPGRSVTV